MLLTAKRDLDLIRARLRRAEAIEATLEGTAEGSYCMRSRLPFMSSGNVFADLGLPDAEEVLVKAAVVSHLGDVIAGRGTSHEQIAELLGINHHAVSDLLLGRMRGFSLARLLSFLVALDQDVDIVVQPKVSEQSRLTVIAP